MWWLLACMVFSALAGCVGTDGPEPEPEPPEALQSEPVPLEPVRIEERIDLRDGLPETNWSLRVGPGHEERLVAAKLVPIDGTEVVVMQNYCYFLDGRPDNGERIRRDGGAGCNQPLPAGHGGSPRTLVYLEDRELPYGDYRFTFSAEPALAVLVLEMVAEGRA